MKKFTLYVAGISNSHLTKDVGLIPFVMGRYLGYESSILAPEIKNPEEEYIDAKKYLNGLKIDFYKDNEDIAKYLLDVDILMLIGIYDFNFPIINYYKSVKPKGKIYLKLDASLPWMQGLNQYMNNDIINILNKCDLITVESKKVQNYINSVWGIDAKYSTNGYFEYFEDEFINYDEKENIIMFAGRIGDKVKANTLLLEAFRDIENEIKDWKLIFAGTIVDEFKPYLENYFKENPSLKEKIIFTGKLDKLELKKLYQKSKIFCLTSLSEGSPNVLPEAIYNGCYFVSTDVGCVYEIVEDGNCGSVFPINDIRSLENILNLLCHNDDRLRINCDNAQIYARENLNWIRICFDIKRQIER